MLRGMGESMLPMVVSMIGSCLLRVVWIYTIFAADRTLPVLYLSYPCLLYTSNTKEQYDDFYAVYMNLDGDPEAIVKANKRR